MPKIDLSAYSYAALIFDCDGTLADTALFHYRALWAALGEQGYELDRGWYLSRLGLSGADLLRAAG